MQSPVIKTQSPVIKTNMADLPSSGSSDSDEKDEISKPFGTTKKFHRLDTGQTDEEFDPQLTRRAVPDFIYERTSRPGTPVKNINKDPAFTGSVPANDEPHQRSATPEPGKSAVKSFQPTTQSINGARFTQLMLNICQEQVRNLLRHFIGGGTDTLLQREIDENMHKFKFHKLFSSQRQILKNPEYSKLDITLMHKIITTLAFCETVSKERIENELHMSCPSVSVALARIVLQRDEFAHFPNIELEESDFNRRWEIVSESMFFIARKIDNLPFIQREVDQLRTAVFSGDEVEKKRQESMLLRQAYETRDLTPEARCERNIKSNKIQGSTKFLESKLKERPFFLQTKAFKDAYKLLTEKGHVLLSGKKGDGRTATAYQLLIELMHEFEVDVHLLKTFELDSVTISDCCTVLIIEDICSDEEQINRFRVNAKFFEAVLCRHESDETHPVFLIMTSHTTSLSKVRSKQSLSPSCLLERNCCIDLSSQSLLLQSDKKEILKLKIRQVQNVKGKRNTDFHDEIVERMSEEYLTDEFPIGFPFIADYFCQNHFVKGAYHFLENPFYFFMEQVNAIFHNSWEQFFVLLKITLLTEGLCIENKLGQRSVNKHDIKKTLNHLEQDGTYVTKQPDRKYDITHRYLKEALKKKFLVEHFENAVQVLNIDTLMKSIYIGQEMDKTKTDTIYLVSSEFDKRIIAERLVEDMKRQKIRQILRCSGIWHNIEFVDIFVSIPDDGAIFLDYKDEKTDKTILAETAGVGHEHLLGKILAKIRSTCKEAAKNDALNEALLSACQHSTKDRYKIITRLIKEGAQMSFCNKNGECPLTKAMTLDTNEALITLLQEKAYIPELRHWRFWGLLHTAAMNGDTLLCNQKFIHMLYNINHNSSDIELEIDPLWKVAKGSFNCDKLSLFYSCVKYIGMEEGLLEAFLDQNFVIKKLPGGGNNVFHQVLQSENDDIQLDRMINVLSEKRSLVAYLNEKNDAGLLPLAVALSNLMITKPILVAIVCGMSKSNMTKQLSKESLHLCIESTIDDSIVSHIVSLLLDNKGMKIDEYEIELAAQNARVDTIAVMLGNRLTSPSTDDGKIHKCIDYNTSLETKLRIIEVMVEKGMNINEENENGQTPLMTALQRCSSLELINRLLDLGADVGAIDHDGNSVLHHCFSSNFPDDLLADWISSTDDIKLVNFDHENKDNETAVMIAAKGVKTEATRELFKLDVDLDQFDKNGNTILHLLIMSDRNDSSTLHLIDSFKEIHVAHNIKGQTPLMLAFCASEEPKLQSITRLMALPIDVTNNDIEGKNLLQYCVESNIEDETVSRFCRTILTKGSNEFILEAMESCADRQRSQTVVVLLEFTDMNDIILAVGRLAFHQCLTPAIVSILHKRLIDVGKESDFKNIAKTILADLFSNEMNVDYAKDMLKAFHEKEIGINTVLDNGKTLLLYAVSEKAPISLIESIITFGAKINSRDINQSGVLHLCLRSTRSDGDIVDILEYLINEGADVNVLDRCSSSPLLEAAKTGNVNALFLLLSGICNPKINVRDKSGKTILHRIVESSMPDTAVCKMLDCLEKRTANGHSNRKEVRRRLLGNECLELPINDADNMGLTPLNAACCNGQKSRILSILKLLQMKCYVHSQDKQGRSIIYNTLRCMDRRDSKSELERLARIAILQLYDCEPGMHDDDEFLPEDICNKYGLRVENLMLQQSQSCREMNAILLQSIERPENVHEPATSLTDVCTSTLLNDTRIERIRDQIITIETILRDINFADYNDESQLSAEAALSPTSELSFNSLSRRQ